MHVSKRSYFEAARLIDSKKENVDLITAIETRLDKKPDFEQFDKDLIIRLNNSALTKSFKNTPGLPKAKTMFNLHRAKRFDKVFVVESSFDAIRLEQIGVHAVATLGASVSAKQRELLKQYFNSVIILGDNDDAGKEMSNKLSAILGSMAIKATLPEDVKDVSDLSDEQLKEFVSKFDNILMAMVQF